jgi:hypothetical protein
MRHIRTRALALALAVGLAFSTAACGANGGDEAATTTTAAADTTETAEETTTTAEVPSEVEPGPVEGWELPQSVTFNGLKWTLDKAEQRDRLDLEGEANASEAETWVAVTWSAENLLDEVTFTIPANMFSLRFEDNEFVVGQSAGDSVQIQPLTDGTGETAFLIPEGADIETATFEFNGPNVEPATIRMDGSVPVEPERVDATIAPASFEVVAEGGDLGPDFNCVLELEVKDAYLSRELHIEDGAPARIDGSFDTRVPEGRVYLNILFGASSTGGVQCNLAAPAIETSEGRDTDPTRAIWWSGDAWKAGALYSSLPEGSSGDFRYAIALPEGAESVKVTWGVGTGYGSSGSTEFTVDSSGITEFTQE